MKKHTIELMTSEHEFIQEALTTYEGGTDIANYFMYQEDDGDRLFFVQQRDGQFYLVLHNLDWLSNDLNKIIKTMQDYFDPMIDFKVHGKTREFTAEDDEKMYEQLHEEMMAGLARVQTKWGANGDIAPDRSEEFDQALQRFLDAAVLQIQEDLQSQYRNAN